jgi:hypothetical protein
MTVYDAGLDDVCSRVRRALSRKSNPEKPSTSQPDPEPATSAVA